MENYYINEECSETEIEPFSETEQKSIISSEEHKPKNSFCQKLSQLLFFIRK